MLLQLVVKTAHQAAIIHLLVEIVTPQAAQRLLLREAQAIQQVVEVRLLLEMQIKQAMAVLLFWVDQAIQQTEVLQRLLVVKVQLHGLLLQTERLVLLQM